MRLIKETGTHYVYVTFIEEEPIRVFKSKSSGQVAVRLDELAVAMGFHDEEEMMNANFILDLINSIHKETGVFPIKPQRACLEGVTAAGDSEARFWVE